VTPEWLWAVAALVLVIVLKVVWSGIKLMLRLTLLVVLAGMIAAAYFHLGRT